METGTKVVLVPVGNNARRHKEGATVSATVTRVGRTYFYVTPDGWHREEISFERESGRQKNTGIGYGVDWHLYWSMQEYKDEIEREALRAELRKFFSDFRCQSRLTLAQLRAIHDILTAAKEDLA